MSITGVEPPVEVMRFKVPETLVTPVPAGVAQVPSPLQNVEELALVPLFKFVTGRFPVTPVVRGSPLALVRVNEVGVPMAKPLGNVVLMLGTPPADVTRTPLFAVASPDRVVPPAAYHANWLISPALITPDALAVVASVPDVGNVTFVVPVKLKFDAKNPVKLKLPWVAIVPPSVIVLAPLLTPVPPRVGDNVPVHPRVKEVALSNAVVGEPPKVSVTLLSLLLVKAAPFD